MPKRAATPEEVAEISTSLRIASMTLKQAIETEVGSSIPRLATIHGDILEVMRELDRSAGRLEPRRGSPGGGPSSDVLERRRPVELVSGLLEDARGKPASPEDGAANGAGGLAGKRASYLAATACGPSACKTVELDRPTSAKPSHGAPRQLPKGVAPLQLPPAGREVDLVLEAASPLSPGPRNRRRSRIMSDELAFERAEAADGEGGSEDAADGGDGGGGACTKEPLMLDVLGYRFDRFFGNWKSVCMLLIATVSLVISGYAYWLAGGAADLTESVWKSWTFMADPGTHSGEEGTVNRLAAALITVGGWFLSSVMLGLVVAAIEAKMENLKKGVSRVVEADHSLVLGWTDQTMVAIEELALSNESEGGGTIVVLAEEDKETIEIELAARLGNAGLRGSRVVVRSGSPMLVQDLAKVSADRARSTLVLAQPGDADRADAKTLRTVLALKSFGRGLQGHVVAEMRDVDNEALVRLIGGDDVETCVSHDLLGRLMLMSAREPGLASVYGEVLGFDGDEFYLQAWDELTGMPFGDLALRFPDAIPIGLRSAETGEITLKPPLDRRVRPNEELIVLAEDNDTYKPEPPPDWDIDLSPPPHVKAARKKAEKILFCGWRRDVRDILLLLDRQVYPGTEVHMMTDSVPLANRDERLRDEGLDVTELRNLRIVHKDGNTSVRRSLEALPIEEYDSCMILAEQQFEEDMSHSDSHGLATLLLLRDIQRDRHATVIESLGLLPTPKAASMRSKRGPVADAAAEVFFTDPDDAPDDAPTGSMLQELASAFSALGTKHAKSVAGDGTSAAVGSPARSPARSPPPQSPPRSPARTPRASSDDRVRAAPPKNLSIESVCPAICEILDPRTQDTIRSNRTVSGASDFVQSNKLVAQILAMVCEDRGVRAILIELLGADGVNFSVRPSRRYAAPHEELSFFELQLRAQAHDEVLCGHQARGRNRKEGGTTINPRDKAVKKCWRDYDLIVLVMASTRQAPGAARRPSSGGAPKLPKFSDPGFSDIEGDGAGGAPPPPPSSQSEPVTPPPAPPSATPPPGSPPAALSPSEPVPPNHHRQAEKLSALACSWSDDESVSSESSDLDCPIEFGFDSEKSTLTLSGVAVDVGNKYRGQ